MTIDEIIAQIRGTQDGPFATGVGNLSLTTKDALALCAEIERLRADHLSSRGTMVELEQARGYAERLFRSWAPQCEPLPDLLGLLTQIDNYVTGLRVKRCHYCNALMRERERTVDGAVVGTYWQCPEGCQ